MNGCPCVFFAIILYVLVSIFCFIKCIASFAFKSIETPCSVVVVPCSGCTLVSVVCPCAVSCVCSGCVVYRDWETDRKSTRLNSSHSAKSRMPSSA